jgi:hypothetical protein
MRGGAIPYNFQQNSNTNSDNAFEPYHNQDTHNVQIQNQDILESLGFEEGELEMFFDMVPGMISEDELINKYLELARSEPFNKPWQNVTDARNADYSLNVFKQNGVEYTKHDIAKDTMNYFYDDMNGGKLRSRKNRKQRKSKKQRKTRSKRRTRRIIRRKK